MDRYDDREIIKTNLIESYDKLIENLFKYSKFYSGAEPSFVEGDVFRIIVPLDDAYSFDFNYTKNKTYEPKNEPNEPKKEWDLGLSENEKQLLNYIEGEATITQKELSEKLNISISTVKRNLFKLKEKGLLIHEGNKRSGKWIILKGGNNCGQISGL